MLDKLRKQGNWRRVYLDQRKMILSQRSALVKLAKTYFVSNKWNIISTGEKPGKTQEVSELAVPDFIDEGD